jgi:hypothetical protein
VVQDIADALSGTNPDYKRLATLRQRVEELLQPRQHGKHA